MITYSARGYPPSEVPSDPEAYSQENSVEDLHQLLQRLNIKEFHEPVYSIDADKQRIDMLERVRYKGSFRGPKLEISGYYALDEEGQLVRHCVSVRSDQDDEELPCPVPMVYTKMSEQTEWTKRRD